MWGRDEKIDKVVRQRFAEVLDTMELSQYDRDRINRRLDRFYPLPISNATIIDHIAKLQQKEGESQTQNLTKTKALKRSRNP